MKKASTDEERLENQLRFSADEHNYSAATADAAVAATKKDAKRIWATLGAMNTDDGLKHVLKILDLYTDRKQE